MAKINIIIPCYNVAAYLEQSLQSIINQTYKNIEIIAINDGSTDNTLSILNFYAEKDKRIKIINQQNRGLSEARNIGLSIASGEYIMFVDSDDWIDCETCEIALAKALDTNADIVFWSYIREFKNRSLKRTLFNEDYLFEGKECQSLYRRLFGLIGEELRFPEHADSFITVWGKLYKRAIVYGIDFIDTKIIGTEDALFNIYVFYRVKKIAYIHKYYYHYRKNNTSSLTASYKTDLFNQWTCLFDYMKNIIILNKLDENFAIALNNRVALSIIGLGLNECSSDKSFRNKIKSLNKILVSERYKIAYKNLKLKYFPVHWKFFFFCAKKQYSIILYFMLLCIKKLIYK